MDVRAPVGRRSLRSGRPRLLSRTIPSSGEPLPAIGLGTYRTFDVADPPPGPLAEVLRRFLSAGGRVLDSSPMYGRAEAAAGALLRAAPGGERAFVATKVWTSGREAGLAQMERSERLLGQVDLMQVHNLVDWRTHLPTLRAWKAEGRIRYVGVTHYALGALADLERVVRTERVDFVQLPYSVGVRDAERSLLPAARDAGTAVLVMRPLEAGGLLRAVARRPLPPVAAALGASSWAELLLKWILAHPAVTAVLPATADPRHLGEDLAAGTGPLPDEAAREAIAAAVEG